MGVTHKCEDQMLLRPSVTGRQRLTDVTANTSVMSCGTAGRAVWCLGLWAALLWRLTSV